MIDLLLARPRARFDSATIKLGVFALSLLMLACSKGGEKPSTAESSTGAEQLGPIPCGATTCSDGQICCNPSCALCTDPGGMCTQQFCDALAGDAAVAQPLAPATISCDNVRCAGGTHCEMVAVQCVKAPCPPVPECKPDAADAGS